LGHCFRQNTRSDLPTDTPSVFAPAALAFESAVIDDSVPISICFTLIFGGNLERESLAVLETRASIKADAGNAGNNELYG
jgi:hypothetical protein